MPKLTKRSTITAIVVLLLLAVAGFSYLHAQQNSKKSESKQSSTQKSSADSGPETKKASDEFGDAVIDNSAVDPTMNSSNSNNYLDVSKDDCTNQCQNFSDPDDLQYCQQICGTIPADDSIKSLANCTNKKNLDKDYCLKDLAINTKNIKVCAQVSDSNIQKICQKDLTPAQ